MRERSGENRHLTMAGGFGLKVPSRIMPALATALFAAAGLQAQEQDIVKEALQFFPADTVHLEYSNPAKLRKLPNYASLRQRYLGAQLQKIEQSLGKLG